MKLPVPNTRTGWMFSLLLILVSFLLYYGCVFGILSDQYEANFWLPSSHSAEQGESIDFDVKVPQYISRSTTREILIRAENKSDFTQEKFNLVVYAGTIKSGECPSLQENTDMVFFCPSADVNLIGCASGSNIIEFGEIPPYGQVVRTIWVVGDKSNQSKSNNEITFGFWKVNEDLNKEIDQGAAVGENLSNSCVKLNGTASASFSPFKTFAQSFLRTLLLPPWSNGLIPVLVLFVVYATEHKIQPNKKKPVQCPKPSRTTYFSHLIKWVKGDAMDRTLVVCSQRCAFVLVAFLYFGLAFMILFIPLIFSGSELWWCWILLGAVGLFFFLVSKHLLGFCEPTDLKDNDPIYQIEQPSAKPLEIEADVKNTLAQIANSLKKSSVCCEYAMDLTPKIESGFSDLTNNLQEVLKRLASTDGNPQTLLADIRQELANMGDTLDKLTNAQSSTNSINIAEYHFNFQAILVDPEALRLFLAALNSVSRPEFEKALKDDSDFSLRLFSLLAAFDGDANELKIEGAEIINIMADSAMFEPVLKKWLDEVDPSYIPRLMDVLLTKKRKLTEKYLFEIDLKKCDALQVILLLAKYITQKRANAENTYIRWHALVRSLISISEKDISEKITVEQAAALNTVLDFDGEFISSHKTSYLSENSPLQDAPLSPQELVNFYSNLLNIVCALPSDLFQLVAKQIYNESFGDNEIPKGTKLRQFRDVYSEHDGESNLPNLQSGWCKDFIS